MKKIISIFFLSIFIGLANVSAATGNLDPVTDTGSVEQGGSITLDVLSNDISTNTGAVLVLDGVSTEVNGSTSYSGTSVTYTPDTVFFGTGSFTYTVSDGTETATGDVIINVIEHINENPEANDDSTITDEDTSVGIDVLDNDTDDDGDDLEVTLITNELNGTTSITSTGVLFTPDLGFVGIASFNYTINDGNGGTDVGHVQITVIAEQEDNNNPIANDDEAETDEDTSVEINVLDNDTDEDGDDLEITLISSELNGEVEFNSSEVIFTPNDGFVGTASFYYTISDGNGGIDIGHVEVEVIANNNNDDDDDIDDDDDDDRKSVKEIQKKFIKEFKRLKNRYKGRARSSREYKRAKARLFSRYKSALKRKTYNYSKKSNKKGKYNYGRGNSNNGKYDNYRENRDDLKAKYKKTYKRKYGRMISNLSDSKIRILLAKIDDLIVTVNGGSYSEDTKEKFISMLEALREIVTETEPKLDIDSLFE